MYANVHVICRIQPAVIKIIGMSSGIYGGPSSPMKYCQLWYRERSSPVVTAAEYNIVPETHDRKYVPSTVFKVLCSDRFKGKQTSSK